VQDGAGYKKSPPWKAGLSASEDDEVLFLIAGLNVLAAAALLGLLAWLAGHWIWLRGLAPLLRWIRLILLCHSYFSSISRRYFVRLQRC
jgi:hypothetical protein